MRLPGMLLTAIVLFGMGLAACQTTPSLSGWTVTIPRAPELAGAPLRRPCTHEGAATTCLVMLEADVQAMHDYTARLQQELESVCVKVGQVTLPKGYQTDATAEAEAQRRVEASCWTPGTVRVTR